MSRYNRRFKGLARRLRRRRRLVAIIQYCMSQNSLLASSYYSKYLHKVPCYNSKLTGYMWMKELVDSQSDVRCINAFRMETHVLERLCNELEVNHGLRPSRNMSILEKVGIFLYTIALGVSNRDVCERFQRSGDTIHRAFHKVLDAITGRSRGFVGLARTLLQPRDPNFASTPDHIRHDNRYTPFRGAIGCIDGTHIDACIPKVEQVPYRGRKGMCSFNVMAVCDFDMYFTFVSSGWEGSAHDARVFDHALKNPTMNFPHPSKGKYYMVDKGYPDKEGYMVPYSKVKYHQSQFQNAAPKNAREAFNRSHSSLRSCIERCFGVLKKRWKILKGMPSYSISTQIDIIIACFALHNFILAHKINDGYLDEEYEANDGPIASATEEGEDNDPNGMSHIRDIIAMEIWNRRIV